MRKVQEKRTRIRIRRSSVADGEQCLQQVAEEEEAEEGRRLAAEGRRALPREGEGQGAEEDGMAVTVSGRRSIIKNLRPGFAVRTFRDSSPGQCPQASSPPSAMWAKAPVRPLCIEPFPASPPPLASRRPRSRRLPLSPAPRFSKGAHPLRAAPPVSVNGKVEDAGVEAGLPPEFYDEEWQARQREKTEEWHAYRDKEEQKERVKEDEYREIGMRLKGYPEEDVCKAKILVSSFIRAAEEVEEKIEAAAEKGELNELVLMIIWNRLDLARRDDEKDAIRSLDLLYRRVETEILKSEATPSMRLLNDLLNLHDGFDDDDWLKKCRKCMIDTFPQEDPFSILVPAGFDVNTHRGRIELPPDGDDVLLRADFIREVDALLQEVRGEQTDDQPADGRDPESVANMLKQHERQRTIRQVEALLDLAVTLKW
ncbi:hypothetical protein Taro_006185 [Colocasia esculenta]|uniref:Protein PALE CRESS, chloroplastic n=1 Tax=Colocasia esculenta TaxID=4460 RepID=A0A843TWK0_COLES|nr:hypothetical protein [Colocasia esculenta]